MNFFTFVFTFVFSLRAGFWIFFPAFPGRRSRISFLRRGLGYSFHLFMTGCPEFLSCGGFWIFFLHFPGGMSRISFLRRGLGSSFLLFLAGGPEFPSCGGVLELLSSFSWQNVQNFFLAARDRTFILLFHDGRSICLLLHSLFGHFSLVPAAEDPESSLGGKGLDIYPAFSWR